MNKWIALVLLFVSGCYRVSHQLEPKVNYAVQDRYVEKLPPSFLPLTESEKTFPWAVEYQIALAFAKKLDLYRAISTFNRAEILIPPEKKLRLQEIQYYTLFCYYLAKKYADVIDTFEHSSLKSTGPSFPVYHDLLIILYESYSEEKNRAKAHPIYLLIEHHYPETAKKLSLSTALIDGDLKTLQTSSNPSPYLKNLLTSYAREKKSITTAQVSNALMPGAGYLYVGQKQSALTAFLLNGLFIAAAAHFFHKGEIAAGIITTSFEAGWYFGGIYGAGQAAKLYNERHYEKLAYPILTQDKLFPVLMLQYGF